MPERWALLCSLWFGVLLAAGCATDLPTAPEAQDMKTPIVFGRTVALVTGKTTRWYEPQVRFFELVNRKTHERFKVDVQSDDKVFVLQIPAGEYELSRVQINEGPFLSMADFSSTFEVVADQITYLGTWRFGVDTPRYDRMVVISTVQDRKDQAEAEREFLAKYPALEGQPVETVLLVPSQAESRLYEVMPYPRYPRYFRRHWW
ncbi:MAG: hypothetical protein AB1555_06085 [Nitrospirota bacterium]